MPNDVEHPFMCLYYWCIFFNKVLVQSLCPYFELLVLLLSCKIFLWILCINPLSECVLKICFQCVAFFIFLSVFWRPEYFIYYEVIFVNLFLSWFMLFVFYLGNHWLTQSHKKFILCFLLQVYVLVLMFRSMVIILIFFSCQSSFFSI